jgi:diphthamide synthase (EF-2-diphthine--ammonia ligase)
MKEIESISNIYCKLLSNGKYSYGFTVSFENGEFHNYIYQSEKKNDKELMIRLEDIREKNINEKNEITKGKQ